MASQDKGALEYDNIIYVPAYGYNRVFLFSFNSNKLGWKKLPAFSGELSLSDMIHEYGVLSDTKGTFGLHICIELIQRQKSFSNLLEDNMRLKNCGALEFYNITYNVEYNWRKLYLARKKEKDVYDETDENEEDGNHSSSEYIKWKQNEASLNWNPVSCDFISGLSLYWVYKKSDSILDLSSFVKGEYGFILRIQLLGIVIE
ncbi:unnamed protein product [Rhizophagus irregularis]|nr:unnamed protein product [Rhizophagus irregularis]